MMSASEYYKRKKEFIPSIMESYRKLDETYDVIVIEGAGSPAEINLKKDDIVNLGFALRYCLAEILTEAVYLHSLRERCSCLRKKKKSVLKERLSINFAETYRF